MKKLTKFSIISYVWLITIFTVFLFPGTEWVYKSGWDSKPVFTSVFGDILPAHIIYDMVNQGDYILEPVVVLNYVKYVVILVFITLIFGTVLMLDKTYSHEQN